MELQARYSCCLKIKIHLCHWYPTVKPKNSFWQCKIIFCVSMFYVVTTESSIYMNKKMNCNKIIFHINFYTETMISFLPPVSYLFIWIYFSSKTLCRTVCKLNKFSHVTPLLHKLHWLCIHYCILFKYNLLIYKAIHFSQPPYLSSLIRRGDLTWGNHLSIFSSKPNKCSGLRSFIVAAPTEWNKLPQAKRGVLVSTSVNKKT